MKKIGIVTYYNGFNYGSVCQAYALQEVLKENGFDAYIIDYLNTKKIFNWITVKSNYVYKIVFTILHPSSIKWLLKNRHVTKKGKRIVNKRKEELFTDFFDRYYNLSTENYCKDIKFDAFICGSDQIWNLKTPGLSRIYFLRFAPRKKRISYAASFGGVLVPNYNKKVLKRYLKGFSHISVREDKGIEIVKKYIDRDVQQVVDPVMLLGKNKWLDLCKDIKVEEDNYILCYFLSDIDKKVINYIDKISLENNLKVLWVKSNIENCNYDEVIVSPIEFVAYISKAKVVFTDSFHGSVFSIIMNKEFYLCARNYEMDPEQQVRIESLFRSISPEMKDKFKDKWIISSKDIDYISVNKNIDNLKNKSLQYLLNSLKSI